MATEAPRVYDDPNRHARAASLEVHRDSVVLHGYQEFRMTRHSIDVLDVDAVLERKYALLKPYLTARYLSGRDVLDLGANGGFFCFLALQNGAERATAVEMDPEYAGLVEEAAKALGVDSLDIAQVNVTDWRRDAGVVLALALIHWIYSCTALLGTLDQAVGLLASLTRYMLLVEWVDPADPAIASFGHTTWNAEVVGGPYDLPTFEKALTTHFDRWEQIGDVSNTRALYVAFRGNLEVDHSSPLPLLKPRETVIYSRRLTSHEGVEYWSRVYDVEDAILKQTTLDLAEREARILSQFSDEAFPRVLDVRPCDEGFSVVTLERIRGTPLPAMAQSMAAGGDATLALADDLLRILTILNDHGIVHRDIKADNIILRDGHPVLLDFGWAVTRGESYFAPRWLGDEGRPPDGSFSDAYAVGKILDSLLPPGTPLRPVIELMTDPDPALRVDDPAVLRTLVRAVREARVVLMIDKGSPLREAPEATIRELLTQISRRNERLTNFRTRVAALEEEVAQERAHATEASSKLARAEEERARSAAFLKENKTELSALKKRLARLEGSMGVRMILALRRSMRRIAPEGTHRRRVMQVVLSVPRRLASSRSRRHT